MASGRPEAQAARRPDRSKESPGVGDAASAVGRRRRLRQGHLDFDSRVKASPQYMCQRTDEVEGPLIKLLARSLDIVGAPLEHSYLASLASDSLDGDPGVLGTGNLLRHPRHQITSMAAAVRLGKSPHGPGSPKAIQGPTCTVSFRAPRTPIRIGRLDAFRSHPVCAGVDCHAKSAGRQADRHLVEGGATRTGSDGCARMPGR